MIIFSVLKSLPFTLLAALVVLSSTSLATNSASLVVEVPILPVSPSQEPTVPVTQVSSSTSIHLTPPTLFPAQRYILVVPVLEMADPQPLPPPLAPQAALPPVSQAAPQPQPHQLPAAILPSMASAVVSAGLDPEPVPLVPPAPRLTTTTSSACRYNIPKFGGCKT